MPSRIEEEFSVGQAAAEVDPETLRRAEVVLIAAAISLNANRYEMVTVLAMVGAWD